MYGLNVVRTELCKTTKRSFHFTCEISLNSCRNCQTRQVFIPSGWKNYLRFLLYFFTEKNVVQFSYYLTDTWKLELNLHNNLPLIL